MLTDIERPACAGVWQAQAQGQGCSCSQLLRRGACQRACFKQQCAHPSTPHAQLMLAPRMLYDTRLRILHCARTCACSCSPLERFDCPGSCTRQSALYSTHTELMQAWPMQEGAPRVRHEPHLYQNGHNGHAQEPVDEVASSLARMRQEQEAAELQHAVNEARNRQQMVCCLELALAVPEHSTECCASGVPAE